MEKVFVIVLYGCVKGICTEDKKETVIKEIAEKEFQSDIAEAIDYVEFQEFKINELKL